MYVEKIIKHALIDPQRNHSNITETQRSKQSRKEAYRFLPTICVIISS